MVRCTNTHIFITMVLVMMIYTYSERSYFSLFNDISVVLTCQKLWKLFIYNRFFHFYFLNIDISVAISFVNLTSSVYILKCLRFSFYLGLSFIFIRKDR